MANVSNVDTWQQGNDNFYKGVDTLVQSLNNLAVQKNQENQIEVERRGQDIQKQIADLKYSTDRATLHGDALRAKAYGLAVAMQAGLPSKPYMEKFLNEIIKPGPEDTEGQSNFTQDPVEQRKARTKLVEISAKLAGAKSLEEFKSIQKQLQIEMELEGKQELQAADIAYGFSQSPVAPGAVHIGKERASEITGKPAKGKSDISAKPITVPVAWTTVFPWIKTDKDQTKQITFGDIMENIGESALSEMYHNPTTDKDETLEEVLLKINESLKADPSQENALSKKQLLIKRFPKMKNVFEAGK